MKGVLTGVATLAAIALAFSSSASAHGSYICTGNVLFTTFDQNIVVPDGASCGLKSDTVNGNISVGNNASLAVGFSTVNGNVDVGSDSVLGIDFGTVTGNTSVGAGSVATIIYEAVNGNYLALDASSDLSLSSFESVTITGGTYTISGNTIAKNLTCDGGATGSGGGNNIGGHNNGCTLQ